LAKAKQKNIVKFSQHERSKVPGERMFIDMSSVKPLESVISKPKLHWLIIVDECTKCRIYIRRKIKWQKVLVSYLKGGEAMGY